MNWMRSLVFSVLFYGLCVVSMPVAVCLPARHIQYLAHYWARTILFLLRAVLKIHYRVLGKENIPVGPAIFASKHQSSWDTIVFLYLLDNPVYVLKRELFWIPFYGWCARKIGMIGIDRKTGVRSLKKLLASAHQVFESGRALVIFPQGTRTMPGVRATPPYQAGVYALARHDTIPLIPVAVNSGLFWPRRRFVKKPGCITIHFLPPLKKTLEASLQLMDPSPIPQGAANRLSRDSAQAFLTHLADRIETATHQLEQQADAL